MYIPTDIEDYIFDFIYFKKCYLEDKNPDFIKKCACVNKNFNKKFKCRPYFFKINNNYLEFCSVHDNLLLENLRRVLFRIKYNYSNPMTFFVNLIINDMETEVALTDFYMEPYIALMDMDYIYHSVSFEELNSIEIKKINIVLRKIFRYLELEFNTQSFGVNSYNLKSKFFYLKELIQS